MEGRVEAGQIREGLRLICSHRVFLSEPEPSRAVFAREQNKRVRASPDPYPSALTCLDYFTEASKIVSVGAMFCAIISASALLFGI